MPVSSINSLLLDCVCWDKDRFGKDYLGEFDLALEEIFTNDSNEQPATWYPLRSKRNGGPAKKSSNVSGEVLLQFTLLDSTNHAATPAEVLEKFRLLAELGNPLAPASGASTPGLQIERSNSGGILEGELGDSDSDDEPSEDIETDDPTKPDAFEKKKRRLRIKGLKKKKKQLKAYEFAGGSDVVGIVFLEIGKITDLPPERNMTRTSFDMDPFVVASLGKKTYRTRVIRHNLNPVFNEKMIFQVLRHEQTYSLSFTIIDRDKLSGNDFIAASALPLKEITDTAPQANPETGLYSLKEPPEASAFPPQPNRSRFKLPLSRSSSSQSLKTLARPGLPPRLTSQNILQAGQSIAGQAIPTTLVPPSTSNLPGSVGGLQPGDNIPPPNAVDDAEGSNERGDPDLHPFTIALKLKNAEKWEEKHSPALFLKAKYVPYPALRQQFWRAMLKQYDTDESGRISKIELTTMLDTLGSTLKESTIDSFFKRYEAADLSVDEAVVCLEDQLLKKPVQAHQTMGDKVKGLMPDSAQVRSYIPQQLGGTAGQPESSAASINESSTSTGTSSKPCSISENATLTSNSQLGVETQTVDALNAGGEEGDYLGQG